MAKAPAPHLAVALDGAGWHPAAWREPTARPADLLTAGYWTDLITEAERGLLDFVTIEDSLGLQSTRDDGPDDRTDQVRGRLDAVLIAARVAPRTRNIGLVPVTVATHTEPFHLSKAIATLDYASTGRAGLEVRVTSNPSDAAHFGRKQVPERFADLTEEAADYIEVVRRLWDSWEDDAEIRDAATGRFIDREKLHYIDFHGKWFNVKGPSITPRPPQGQPLVAALAHDERFYGLAQEADVAFVTGPADVAGIRNDSGDKHVFADLVVFLDGDGETGAERKQRLDALSGGFASGTPVFTGSAGELADVIEEGISLGLSGFRLRPAALPDDLTVITRHLVPVLQARGLHRREYESDTLRGLLGLPRPVNRYAA